MQTLKNKSTPPAEVDERIIPDETDQGIISVHLKRYGFAAEFCRGKRVLDVACGVGYGSNYLGADAAFVSGVDCSEQAVAYARRRYSRENVEFRTMDACELSFSKNSFDVVCSFETIEHLPDVDRYLKGVVSVLRHDGVYLVSTPCVAQTTTTPENPHHYVEWHPLDFKRLLSRHFNHIRLFGQRRKQTTMHRLLQKADIFKLRVKFSTSNFVKGLSRTTGTTPFADMSLDDLEIAEDDFRNATETVAVCSLPQKK